MTPKWQLIPYEGLDGLQRLEADWRRLVAALPDRSFNHLFETNVAFSKHMPSTHGTTIYLALHDGDRVRAICPIEQNLHYVLGTRSLRWGLPAGGGDLPRDMICGDDEAEREILPRVLDYIRTAGGSQWVVFERVLETSAIWHATKTLKPGTVCIDVASAVYYLDADLTHEARWATLSRHFRQNMRTANNRLAKLADVRFANTADKDEIATAFELFLAVEGSGWKGAEGTSVLAKPRLLGFHRELVETLSHGGEDRVEIDTLFADGQCIGAQFCFRTGSEYSVLKTGFDERYSRVDPGHLMLEKTVERSCADPAIKTVDMVSNAAWLHSWQPRTVLTQNVYVCLAWWAPVMTKVLQWRFRWGPPVKRLFHRVRGVLRGK